MTSRSIWRAAVYLYAFALVCAFFYAGAGVFGVRAGVHEAPVLDAHRLAGTITQAAALILLVAALATKAGRRSVTLSAVVLVVSGLQGVWAELAHDSRWVGGVHTLGALTLAVLTALLMRTGRGRA